MSGRPEPENGRLAPLIDAHSHVSPSAFPPPPRQAAAGCWPSMNGCSSGAPTMFIGKKPFRRLDSRSWDVSRRIDDMDRRGIAMQVLSPMPELLSYWMEPADAELICDQVNEQITGMIGEQPSRFRGLGAVPLQDTRKAVAKLVRLRQDFGLHGIEIGSNINGVMLGDPRWDPLWEAAEAENLAIFVHALHPVIARSIDASQTFAAFAGFPIDTALAAASMLLAGVIERFPRLRLGFSHGGGALGAMLGRLDVGWEKTQGFGAGIAKPPSEAARTLFFDSNVYDPLYLRHLVDVMAPGRIFAGSDYPYQIMQDDLSSYIDGVGVGEAARASLRCGAISDFLGERLEGEAPSAEGR